MMKFRKLRASEIECRVSQINAKGLMLLLYKDARVDQKLLDEVVGPENWQRKHELINGNLFCNVGIRTEHGDWAWKEDVGVESYTEKEKGQASDSFKRACFNWGIGRELYSAPLIWISADKVNIQERNGKAVCYDRFDVSMIDYNSDGDISMLTIVNEKTGNVVFRYEGTITETEAEDLTKALNEVNGGKGVNMEALLKQFGVKSIKDLKPTQMIRIYGMLNEAKT